MEGIRKKEKKIIKEKRYRGGGGLGRRKGLPVYRTGASKGGGGWKGEGGGGGGGASVSEGEKKDTGTQKLHTALGIPRTL